MTNARRKKRRKRQSWRRSSRRKLEKSANHSLRQRSRHEPAGKVGLVNDSLTNSLSSSSRQHGSY